MPWPYKRNIAQEFEFPLFDAIGNLVRESGVITKQVAIDGQNFVNVSGSINLLNTSGIYKFSGQAADWNGARLTFIFTSPIVKPTVLTYHTDSKQFSDIPSLADLKAQAENAITAFQPSKTSVSGRLFDVSAGGEVGLDWANIGSPDTVVSLGGTTIRGSGMTISGVVSTPSPPPTSQDIWSYPTRALTDKSNFNLAANQNTVTFSGYVSDPGKAPSAQDIWSYVGRDTGLTTVAISGVWGNSVRTLTSAGAGGATAQEVWEYSSRSLTDKSGFSIAGTKTTLDALNDVSASGVWGHATRDAGLTNVALSGIWGKPVRTLTSGGGGDPADVIWAYATRSLTDKSGFSLATDQSTVRVSGVTVVSNLDKNNYNLASNQNTVTFSGYVSDPGKAPTTQDIWAFSTRIITDKAGFSLAADQSGVTVGAVSGAVGSVTGNVGGNVTGSIGSVSQSGISPASFGADVREQVASALIKRGMVKDEGSLENRSLGWAISKLVNKLDMNAGQTTLTIRKTDDSTALYTQAISTSGGALPVTAIDTV